MYSIVVNKYGSPDILEYQETVSKKIADNCVRIRVNSAGINFADILTIKGKYQERPRPPFSPGLEISGEVIETGILANKYKTGDKVMGIMKFGGYQTEVVIPEENTYRIPDTMPLEIAAGFPVIYGTAYSALFSKAKINEGETCLILGATGGVGIATVEIAKAMKSIVIACGGDNKKLQICKLKGADYLINYKENILRNELKKLKINSVDVVIDMIGGQYSLDAIKSLNWDGRIVIVGFASGRIPEIPSNRLLLNNANAMGLYWGELAYRNPKEIEKDFEELNSLYEKKLINPENFKIYNLKNASLALNTLINRENVGKLILKC